MGEDSNCNFVICLVNGRNKETYGGSEVVFGALIGFNYRKTLICSRSLRFTFGISSRTRAEDFDAHVVLHIHSHREIESELEGDKLRENWGKWQ